MAGGGGGGGIQDIGVEWSRVCKFKIREILRMFEDESQRLQAVAQACDRLKANVAAKASDLAMAFNEITQHQDYLTNVMSGDNLTQSPSSESGCLEYILNRIDDLYDVHQNQFQVSKAVRQSVVSIGFVETCLGPGHHNDEVVMDLGSDNKFPPNLLIASRAIQELIVDQIVNHPSETVPEEEDPNEDVTKDAATAAPTPDNSDNVDAGAVVVLDVVSPPAPAPAPEVTINETSSPPPLSTSAPAAPLTWSEVSKINCPTKPESRDVPTALLPRPERLYPETNRPHCYFDCHSVRDKKSFRFVIRVRPDKAPFMSENFIHLCMGKRGFGYKGSKFFRCKPDDHVVMGDFERNDGSGGRSAFATRFFMAEQCPLKDHKGAVRMRGMERTADGRCKVGSQFMVWVGDIDYKEYKYTLVFGEVTHGLKHLQDISRIGMIYSGHETWLLREDVIIADCGVL